MFCTADTSDAAGFNKTLLVDNWGFTKMMRYMTTYSWTISESILGNCEIVESPIFSAVRNNNETWQLQLHPCQDEEWMGLFLKRVSGDDRTQIIFELALLIDDNTKGNEKYEMGYISKGKTHGFKKFVRKSSITYFTNITIIATILTDDKVVNITGGCDHLLPTVDSYPANFETLLEKELYSDAKLKIKGQEFYIHRAILTLVNPKILEKFKVTESTRPRYYGTQRFYETNDVDPKVFRKVLRYIYTGKLDDIKDSARDVMPVATMFHIERLIKLCEVAICQSLNATNAIDVLDFAWKHQSVNLEHQAKLFIESHAPTVVNSPAFKTMESSQPHSFLPLYRNMVERTKN